MALNNKALREQARLRIKGHWGILALILLASILPTLVFVFISEVFFPEMIILYAILSFMLSVITFPVVTLGFGHAMLRTWRGEKPTFYMLFRYCNQRDFPNAILVGTIYHSILSLLSIPQYINQIFTRDSVDSAILFWFSLVFLPISIWVTARLMLIPYMISAEPVDSLFSLFAESFRRMKGNVGSYIRLTIAVMWWRVLVAFLICIVLLIPVFIIEVALDADLLFGDGSIVGVSIVAIGILTFLIISPRAFLTLAGFANNHIASEKELRKAESKKAVSKQ